MPGLACGHTLLLAPRDTSDHRGAHRYIRTDLQTQCCQHARLHTAATLLQRTCRFSGCVLSLLARRAHTTKSNTVCMTSALVRMGPHIKAQDSYDVVCDDRIALSSKGVSLQEGVGSSVLLALLPLLLKQPLQLICTGDKDTISEAVQCRAYGITITATCVSVSW